jgi:hypothetical protein
VRYVCRVCGHGGNGARAMRGQADQSSKGGGRFPSYAECHIKYYVLPAPPLLRGR